MTPRRRTILITGAAGTVGTLLVRGLEEHYPLRLHDREGSLPALEQRARAADLSRYDEVRPLMDGVDTVVHLAGSSSPESTWEQVLEGNIIGVRNVYEAAREAGVRRVVFASSNHAMGMYDRHEEWPVYPADLPRGDSLYGVSKIFGETLGRYYHDDHGLDVIALRIGWVSEDPLASDHELLRSMWLSPADCVQVVRCAIEAPVRFGLFYAISDNPGARWSTTNTRLELGYRPEDSWTDRTTAPAAVVPGGAGVEDSWPEGT